LWVDELVRQKACSSVSLTGSGDGSSRFSRCTFTMSGSLSASRAQLAQAVGRTAGRLAGSRVAIVAARAFDAQHLDRLAEEIRHPVS